MQLAYYEARLQQARTQRPPGSVDELAGALFPGLRFVGPSGRYEAWRDEAFVQAFVLDAVGIRA